MICSHNLRQINERDFYILETKRERILFLLRYAILAPSTHNSQPWKFKLKNEICEMHKDLKRLLPQADKTEKNLYISLGCCLENLVIAAKYLNINQKVIYHRPKNSQDSLVATVKFENIMRNMSFNSNYKDIFSAIQERTTHRGIYTKKAIDKKIIQKIIEDYSNNKVKVQIITHDDQIKKIAQLTQKSIKYLYSLKPFRRELSQWINNNFSQKKEGIPGYALKLPTVVSLFFPLLLKYINISQAISYINYKSILSMSAVCIICAQEETQTTWLEVGRTAERVMLQLTSQNIRVYITVAAIDVEKTFKKVKSLINLTGSPQFLFGLGYSSSNNIFTQRINVENKII